jgi:hypothetical protein
VKATPAFNSSLCEKHKVPPLEFNGREDSLFQAYNLEKKKFMEYVAFHGVYSDIPVSLIVEGWRKVYGDDLVNRWIRSLEERGDGSSSHFETEDVLDG